MAKRKQLVDHLLGVDIFAACSRADMKILARHTVEVDVPAGATIVNQGESGDAFYVVLEGQANVTAKVGRTNKTMAKLKPGSFFGELAVLDPGPRNATVVADTDMVVGVLGARVFRAVLRDVPSLTDKLLAGLARRIREGDSELQAKKTRR